MKTFSIRSLSLVLASVGILVTLSGCDPVGFMGRLIKPSGSSSSSFSADSSNHAQGGEVLVRAFGHAYVSEEPFKKKLTQMLQASPYTRGVDLAMLPAEAKVNFLKDWVNFLLIKDVWGKENDIESSAEFNHKFQDQIEAIRDSLVIDAFVQHIKSTIKVSDSDIEKDFEANKDRYVKSAGGNQIFSARTENSEMANAILKRARKITKPEEFKLMIAEFEGAEYEAHDYLSPATEKKASSLPGNVLAVAADPDCARATIVEDATDKWILFCANKKGPEFFKLAEIKDQVRGMIEEMRHKEAIDKELAKMREKAQVEFVESPVLATNNVRVLSAEQLAQAVKPQAGVAADQVA